MLSPNTLAAKKTKYLAKFQNAWKSEFKWCQASSKGPDFAYCTTCFLSLTVIISVTF